MNDIEKRLLRLESAMNAAQNLRLFITQNGTAITISGLVKGQMHLEAKTPLEAVELVEERIIRKKPEHVIYSYSMENMFDLFPEWREPFAEYLPVPTSNITHGDYTATLGDFPLRHIILYNHVHTFGYICGGNDEKGFGYSEADFQRMLPYENVLFEALLNILTKEQRWRETSDKYRPDTAHCSFGNMQYGQEFLRLQAEQNALPQRG